MLNREEESLSLFTVIGSISEMKKKNKNSSWNYGYNPDYDVVVISKNGKIGDVININGLKIALPLQPKRLSLEAKKRQSSTGKQKNIQENYLRLRPFSNGMSTRLHSKNHGLITSKMNSKEEKWLLV